MRKVYTQEARKKKREINRRLPVVVERNARDRENRQQRGEGRGGGKYE